MADLTGGTFRGVRRSGFRNRDSHPHNNSISSARRTRAARDRGGFIRVLENKQFKTLRSFSFFHVDAYDQLEREGSSLSSGKEEKVKSA